MTNIYFILLFLLFFSCNESTKTQELTKKITKTSLVILGNVQDAGSPHIACKKDCCAALFKNPDPTRKVVSLGLIIPESKQLCLFEATPDITTQMKMLREIAPFDHNETPDDIFISHAHIGHYVGLMYLGKEAMNAKEVRVHVMPRMLDFLTNNGPWSQLVNLKNIRLIEWLFSTECSIYDKPDPNDTVANYPNIHIRPFTVPHRDEFSETVGFRIMGLNKTAIFIPDIDKWEKWEDHIIKGIKNSLYDYFFIDGTFYDGNELPGRDMKKIPHPFVIESMELFKDLSKEDKAKIHFIHFNHTNPLLNKNSKEYKEVIKRGFNIANFGDVFEL